MALIDDVAAALAARGTPYALIGAAAMAVHGVSRSTLDQDLLVTDLRVFAAPFWTLASDVSVELRRGDGDDPLAGVVRIRRDGDRDVDVVVGRSLWQDAILARARAVAPGRIRVAEAADVILLKLYAGGSQDKWDVEQLLAGDATLAATVDARVAALPAPARTLWAILRP